MDYELIDAGGGKKLERFGNIITIRPEVNAYFRSGMDFPKWYEKAHYEFIQTKAQKGYWKELNPTNLDQWIFDSNLGFSMFLEKTKFKHVGLFPEQHQHWKYIQQYIKEGDSFLNLFGYTGAASLAAKAKKANVTHVDSVKQVVTWSRKNMELSNLSDIRWIVDDAFTYIQREQRRGNTHKGIIMDPPAFGIGKNNKRWLIEDKIEDLLKVAYSCLDKNGFLLINTYSPKIKAEDLKSLAKRNITHHKSEVFPLVQKTKTGKILEHNLCLKIRP